MLVVGRDLLRSSPMPLVPHRAVYPGPYPCWVLDIFIGEDSIISLVNLLQCLAHPFTTLGGLSSAPPPPSYVPYQGKVLSPSEQKRFSCDQKCNFMGLMWVRCLLSSNCIPLRRVWLLCIPSIQVLIYTDKIPLPPSLPQADQCQLSQLLLIQNILYVPSPPQNMKCEC